MRIEINLQEGLSPDFKEKVQRQLAFKLGNKAASIESVRASVKKLKLAEDAPWYVCSVTAKLRNGHTHEAEIRGRQPNICIADSASRLSRAITRDAQHLIGQELSGQGEIGDGSR